MMLIVRTASVIAAAALLAITGGLASAEEEKVLNVYNWSDYVAPDTIANFTKATGIKVNYDVYDSNDMLEAKLMVGKSGYDVVFPSATPFFARQVKAGLYRKLDLAKIPTPQGVDPCSPRTSPRPWCQAGSTSRSPGVVRAPRTSGAPC